MQALITCERTVFGRLVSDQIDRWMDGRSVGDRLDSKPAGWFDQPTNKPDNKQTSRQANHRPSIRPINRWQQTNQPSDRLATNPTTDNPSIRPTANQPTRHSSYKRSLLEFPVSGLDVPLFLFSWLHGCIPTGNIQATYKRTPTSPSDPHFSIWLSPEPSFQSPNFWGVVPVPYPQVTGQVMGFVYLVPQGVYTCIYHSSFQRTPLTKSGNAP